MIVQLIVSAVFVLFLTIGTGAFCESEAADTTAGIATAVVGSSEIIVTAPYSGDTDNNNTLKIEVDE